ncbi:M3 family oligoendopeptidase [Aestuariispira ectoiniformans]|uniref:M3 family oligoendopeptidase n=1 Tax=Aestuariispira ectoiniformans TaxID=2775080 RepID=UPI00223B5449|nr:M3 family oligoendopeptidase [Aestuariispira ectoiniformans]
MAESKLENLPTWDLSDLYDGMDCPALKADMDSAAAKAELFAKSFQGRLEELSGEELAKAIADYEALDETLSRVMSYAYLLYAGDVTDAEIGRFFQNSQERVNDISTALLFFSLELNRLEEDHLQARIGESEELARYAPWLRDVRALREHQLSDELERLLHEKSVAGRSAWVRLFDETLAGLRFPFQGEDLTNTEILNLMHDRDGAKRKEAAKSLGQTLAENIRIFTLITNTLAKDKAVEDNWRGFARPVSSRNLSNYVEDEVVDALVEAVRDSYPELSHRYYRLKAKWLGQEKLDYWDRLAPLPDEDDSLIEWPQATETVLTSYGRFSPELADIGKRFFDNAWIDAPARPGKASGAFAHPTVPSAHPYLLLNYQGKTRDVMTLAHELGHGVHQVLAGVQGHLMADTPLTLAETASVFGEMLTFQGMLSNQDDPKKRKAMLAAKVEDMLNTVVRQIAFFEFERRLHDARKEGEVTSEQIGEIWMAVSEESLGDAIRFDEDYRTYWAYIPHFIHSPFYVYAYAFGDCLVNSLYAVYEKADKGFAEKYLEMLKAGGTLRHKELLAPFGLDASDPQFWKQGLSLISRFIDELEAEE